MRLLPALDLVGLASFLGAPSQSQAVRQLRAAMAADEARRKRQALGTALELLGASVIARPLPAHCVGSWP